jgi:hypothetical protein
MNEQSAPFAQSEIATVTALFRRITMSSLERILKPSFWGGRCTKSEVKDANMVVIQVEWLPWAVKNHYRLV